MIHNVVGPYFSWVVNSRWYANANTGNTLEASYNIHALTGEAGELADKFKKMMRSHGDRAIENADGDDLNHMLNELGDVLWYVTNLCAYFGITLEDLILLNTVKLHERGLRKPEGWDQTNAPEWPFYTISYNEAKRHCELLPKQAHAFLEHTHE